MIYSQVYCFKDLILNYKSKKGSRFNLRPYEKTKARTFLYQSTNQNLEQDERTNFKLGHQENVKKIKFFLKIIFLCTIIGKIK